MGFFSWNTSDTNRSIASSYSNRQTFGVTLKDNNGNTWYEPNYEGYGVFGGVDIFEVIAIMNGWLKDDIDKFNNTYNHPRVWKATDLRDIGICIWEDEGTALPILVEDSTTEWADYLPLDMCEYQGFFYPEDDEEHFSL